MIFMAAARRGQGKLKRSLDGDDGKKYSNSAATINQGKGQLVTGVSLPTEVNFFKFDPWKAFCIFTSMTHFLCILFAITLLFLSRVP